MRIRPCPPPVRQKTTAPANNTAWPPPPDAKYRPARSTTRVSLQVERLPDRRPPSLQDDDARGRRVHPALPHPRAADEEDGPKAASTFKIDAPQSTDISGHAWDASFGRVEDGRGSLGHAATLRFPSPLIEPDVPISGIRLSDWLHRKAHGARDQGRRSRRSTPRSP
jgi:hypothetical protein